MNRDAVIGAIESTPQWDLVVIGGGATGLGVALEAASRGYQTLLLEAWDFSKGTSSRSTKLIHGGVRYLRQGQISLVRNALYERGLLFQNAPHLVQPLVFVIPAYHVWEIPFYWTGLKLYDRLAGKLGIAPSGFLSTREVMTRIPTLKPRGLKGGISYLDAQFDDARLAISLLHTLADQGGTAANYFEVKSLLRHEGRVVGVRAQDREGGTEHEVLSRVVVNATGVFADDIRRMDEPGTSSVISPSQGVHLVLPEDFLKSEDAVIVPRTDDGRVLFAVPWHGRVVVGTTDTPVPEVSLEPRPLEEEVEFLLGHCSRYLSRAPLPDDVLSVFAGLRPLVSQTGARTTASVSRDHALFVSASGLVTITGGKWTTYRCMAEEAVDRAAEVAGLAATSSVTRHLPLHGWSDSPAAETSWQGYGADAVTLDRWSRQDPSLQKKIHSRLPYSLVEVVWAVREEMARTVEDVLSRRTRALFLDAAAAVEAAPGVAALMARELGRESAWERQQVLEFGELAAGYRL